MNDIAKVVADNIICLCKEQGKKIGGVEEEIGVSTDTKGSIIITDDCTYEEG